MTREYRSKSLILIFFLITMQSLFHDAGDGVDDAPA
jgi:hypothetical protein